jgi:hypothetical protein
VFDRAGSLPSDRDGCAGYSLQDGSHDTDLVNDREHRPCGLQRRHYRRAIRRSS